jgi:cytochrome c-type biogenesis protein
MTSEDKHPGKNQRTRQNRIGIFLLVAIAVWFALQISRTDLLPKGTDAPNWSLSMADGSKKTLDMKEMRGNVAVIEFLSLGCPHCVREQGELSELLRKMEPKGVKVVGIVTGGEDVADIEDYNSQRRPDFPLVVDTGDVTSSYKVNSFPTIYVIDRQGKVADAHPGFWKLEDMAQAVAGAAADEKGPLIDN